jgi:cytochrome c553
MKRNAFVLFAMGIISVSALSAAALHSTHAQSGPKVAPTKPAPLYWAYAVNPPSTAKPAAPGNNAHHVPGSSAAFTSAQIADLFHPPDWHPQDHPAMPPIVAEGRKPDVYACGYCHLPNGQGRPENANLAGLPAAYIVQQMADFKSGLRKGSEPRHLPTNYMLKLAAASSADDARSSAEYFSQLKPKPWIRVVESVKVPRTHVAGWMLVASGTARSEPIGLRIIEIPEDLERTELRDGRSGFIAYVPPRSISKGKELAENGGDGKTLPCSLCHGPDLRGNDNVPSIAGRSPSYIVRQLNDMKNGNRHGAAADQMKPVVQNLTVADMIALAAYSATLRP